VKRITVKEAITATDLIGSTITVNGWVRTFRSNRFIAINDGSTIKNIQAVIIF
jgi:asparaginyl-tRNA synthetase